MSAKPPVDDDGDETSPGTFRVGVGGRWFTSSDDDADMLDTLADARRDLTAAKARVVELGRVYERLANLVANEMAKGGCDE